MSDTPETGPRPAGDARDDRQEQREPMGRGNRIPLGVQQLRLDAIVPDHMVGRWMNDTRDRLQRAIAAGYTFINDKGKSTKDRKSACSRPVGVQEGGKPLVAYLMGIPRQFYDEDQAVKEREIAKMDEAIKRGTLNAPDQAPGASPEDKGKFYDAGISHDPGGH